MSVDLATAPFWLTLTLSYLLLTPITSGSARQTVFCLVNLTFVGVILGPELFLAVLVFLVSALALVRALKPPHREASLVVLSVSLLGLFLLTKRVDWAIALTIGTLGVAFSAIGYSYLLLRLAYLIKTVWEERTPPPGFSEFINYLIPFHMLAAGPIQTYEEFRASDLGSTNREDLVIGVERISTGLFKKFVLAESLRLIFFTDYQHPDAWYLFLELQISYLWLFLDFSGYSDIAVGVGRILGFRVPENFNNPLLARNLIDFWQRWHITLSDFIKTEIFMPVQFWLMRNRIPERPLLAALISFNLAFVLCGLWHGISLRFALWGLFHGIGLTVCRAYQSWLTQRIGRKRQKALNKNPWLKALSVLLTFEFVAFSWFFAIGPIEMLWER